MANQYTEDSIQKMTPLQFTRHRPDAYLGSNEDSTQLAMEIITNAIDEHLIGNCATIIVSYNKDLNEMEIADDGQGILPNVQKGNKTVLQMIYDEINTSGKFDKSDDAVYKVSTGSFGIGGALTNFLSSDFYVITKRDGQYEEIWFKDGIFEKRNKGKCNKDEHGVCVKYKADNAFFVNKHIDEKRFVDTLENICCICPQLTIVYNDKNISHHNGINDLIDIKLNKDVEMLHTRCLFDITQGRQQLNFGITWSTNGSASDIIPFCNYGLIEAGAPVSAVKGCITKTLNKWAKEQKLIKEKDSLNGSSLQEGMIVVFNLVSPNIRYDSQTKVRATSTADNPFINEVLSKQFEIWLDSNPNDGKIIIEKALLARKAAEAAKKAREAVKAGKNKKKDKVQILHPDKLKDAEFLGNDSILLCVEGE